MTEPILVACSHGTAEESARAAIAALVDSVRSRLGVEVRQAFVDVQEPRISAEVARIPAGPGISAVVVPVLLSVGYHVHVDIARAVAGRPDVLAAPPLGPDPRLLAILLERLEAAGAPLDAAVVLAAAGSSDERSRRDTDAMVAALAAVRSASVTLGFAAGIHPTVAEAVAEARSAGAPSVAVASFLLAPGTFQSRLALAGADVVTEALAPHPGLVAIVVDRYDSAADARRK